MKPKPWRDEVIEAAKAINDHLVSMLSSAGSMGTRSVDTQRLDLIADRLSRSTDTLDAEWSKWFHFYVDRPLRAASANTQPGLVAGLDYEQIPSSPTGEEKRKKEVAVSDSIQAHRNKLWVPFNEPHNHLMTFIGDFLQQLKPPSNVIWPTATGDGKAIVEDATPKVLHAGSTGESAAEPMKMDKGERVFTQEEISQGQKSPVSRIGKNKGGRKPEIKPALEKLFKGPVGCKPRTDNPIKKLTLDHWAEALVGPLKSMHGVDCSPDSIRNELKGVWCFDSAKRKGADWTCTPVRLPVSEG